MRCKRCEGETQKGGTLRRGEVHCRPLTCDRCGAAILTLAGVAVGVGDDLLAYLARFGLASTGKPLLQPRREEG